MSAVPIKVADALERAFREHEAESFSKDAALVAFVLTKHHGDDAVRVAELAATMLRTAGAEFAPQPAPPADTADDWDRSREEYEAERAERAESGAV
jgi:hypothetical protein